MNVHALIAVFIACIGLFGIFTAHDVSRQIKSIFILCAGCLLFAALPASGDVPLEIFASIFLTVTLAVCLNIAVIGKYSKKRRAAQENPFTDGSGD